MICKSTRPRRRRRRKYIRPRFQLLVFVVILSVMCGVRISRYSLRLPYDPQDYSSTVWKPVASDSFATTITKSHRSFTNSTSVTSHGITSTLERPLILSTNVKVAGGSTTVGMSHSHNATFSFCLLVKDDNDILNEWLAYHYHTLNLRHVIVAIDPSSKTSPSPIFDKWQELFGLKVEIWTDSDYMPEYFVQGNYDQVPSFLPDYIKANISASLWHVTAGITDTDRIRRDLQHINNHRFRQAMFLHKCVLSVRQKHDEQKQKSEEGVTSPSWLAHIDSDEYIVVNPRVRARSPKALQGLSPVTPHASSVLDFLEDMFVHYPKRLSRACLALPSMLFGAIEDDRENFTEGSARRYSVPSGWNTTRFETLRWKYHAAFNDTISGLQKTIMDVSVIRSTDMIFHRHAHSIHRPSIESCRQMKLRPDFDSIRLYPLTVNHYVGSYERYIGRDDVRRNEEVYRRKASVKSGGKDDDWMMGWLGSFIETHGQGRVSMVLQDYLERS